MNLTVREKFDTVICFHHSGQIIYWYYKQKGIRFSRDNNLAKKISEINGYRVIPPEESDEKAAGFKDWFVKKFKKPGFTIEIGEKTKVEKTLSVDKLNQYFEENREVLLAVADYINKNLN